MRHAKGWEENMPSPARSARERRRFFFAVAFFAICSFAIWPARHVIDLYFSTFLDEPELAIIPFYGMVAAGGALLAIWSVLGSEPFWIRTGRSVLGCVLLSGCWVLGFFALMSYSSGHSVEFIDWLCYQLHLPLLFVAIQIPLWALRCVFRKGLVSPNGQGQTTSQPPLTIGDALSQAALVGCAFASLHIAYWLWGYNSLDYASELTITSLFCLFVSGALVVPTVIAVLRPLRNGYAAVASIACVVLPQVALFPLTPALYPSMYNFVTHQNVLLVKLTVFMFTTSLTGTLVLARWSEFRLGRALQATVNKSQLPEQRTRHWQFGLRGVMVVATLVAICLGTIIGPEMRRRAYQTKIKQHSFCKFE